MSKIQDGSGPVIVARPAKLLAILAIVAAFFPKSANGQNEVVGFKMPSSNIYCMVEPPVENQSVSDLRCDLQQMTSKPPPAPKDCPLSWGDAFSISQDGNQGIRVCHGDTTKDDALMVLAYGTEWKQDGFLCKSATSGLTCTNAKGHGFTLSRAAQKVF